MKTSYQEISKTKFEIFVTTDEDEKIPLGIICKDFNGKWFCDKSYFAVSAAHGDAIKNNDSMIECGRNLVKLWQKYKTQRDWEEKLRKLGAAEKKASSKQYNLDDDSFFDSLWDGSYDPFGGEP